MIAASATTVNNYSMKGELIVSWRRTSHRGEWLTDPVHLPESYKQMSEWNTTYFIRKAMSMKCRRIACALAFSTTQRSTVSLPWRIAADWQSKQIISYISYSFIKNSIVAVAEEIGTARFHTKLNEELIKRYLL